LLVQQFPIPQVAGFVSDQETRHAGTRGFERSITDAEKPNFLHKIFVMSFVRVSYVTHGR